MESINTVLAIGISSISIIGTIVVVVFFFAGHRSRIENLEEKVGDLEEKIYKDMVKEIKIISENIIKLQSDFRHFNNNAKPLVVDRGDIDALIKAFVQIKEN